MAGGRCNVTWFTEKATSGTSIGWDMVSPTVFVPVSVSDICRVYVVLLFKCVFCVCVLVVVN